MSYENCFTCEYFKSNPERCICKDLKNLCKREKIDPIDVKKRSIVKRVKLLCEVLEIDHLGLVSEGVRRLQDEYNKYIVRGHKESDEQQQIDLLDNRLRKTQDQIIEIKQGFHRRTNERLVIIEEKVEGIYKSIHGIEPTEDELLKDQENHEIMEAEIKAERKREGG